MNMLRALNKTSLQNVGLPWAQMAKFSPSFTQRVFFNSSPDDDGGDDDGNGDNDLNEAPFPRIGWSPGSFGARALRRSKARLPGEPTGRTKPKRAEEDYWLEAYRAYGVEERGAKEE